jgi:hypothetical protein
MRLIDKTPKVSRRTLLKTGSVTAAAAAMAPAAVMTGKAWAAAPVAVSADEFATLVKMARDIYPHDGHVRLGDHHYAKVIEGLDSVAKDDAEQCQEALPRSTGGHRHEIRFLQPGAEQGQAVAILQSMEYALLPENPRGADHRLYNNKEVWPFFGYEGESFSKGGYINRGFNDINWLDQG